MWISYFIRRNIETKSLIKKKGIKDVVMPQKEHLDIREAPIELIVHITPHDTRTKFLHAVFLINSSLFQSKYDRSTSTDSTSTICPPCDCASCFTTKSSLTSKRDKIC